MNATEEIVRNPVSKHQIPFSLSMEMSGLTRDGTVESVSRDQILRCERGQGNSTFPCSADHEQDCDNLIRLIHTLAICATIHVLTTEGCICKDT